jgi:hypothetical protein
MPSTTTLNQKLSLERNLGPLLISAGQNLSGSFYGFMGKKMLIRGRLLPSSPTPHMRHPMGPSVISFAKRLTLSLNQWREFYVLFIAHDGYSRANI